MTKEKAKLMDTMVEAICCHLEGADYSDYAEKQSLNHKKKISYEAWVLLVQCCCLESYFRSGAEKGPL